jgi:hypothetical protein
MFRKKLEEYISFKKCKTCGHRRFYLDKERNDRAAGRIDRSKETCYCSGHKHPHRPGVKFCFHHSNCEKDTRIARYDENPDDVETDISWNHDRRLPPDAKCPF